MPELSVCLVNKVLDESMKHDRVEDFIEHLSEVCGKTLTPLEGYRFCFNEAMYYEAHDVLEHQWLTLEKNSPQYQFQKALIQIAGSFVHFKLHRLFPDHHAHSRRLEPAYRLLSRAMELMEESKVSRDSFYEEMFLLARDYLSKSMEEQNPWTMESRPILK